MVLSAKHGWIKWATLALAVVFAAAAHLLDFEDQPLAIGLEAFIGLGIVILAVTWAVCATLLICPNCRRLVGSEFGDRICRGCGRRL